MRAASLILIIYKEARTRVRGGKRVIYAAEKRQTERDTSSSSERARERHTSAGSLLSPFLFIHAPGAPNGPNLRLKSTRFPRFSPRRRRQRLVVASSRTSFGRRRRRFAAKLKIPRENTSARWSFERQSRISFVSRGRESPRALLWMEKAFRKTKTCH